jgi:hypothetical protein
VDSSAGMQTCEWFEGPGPVSREGAEGFSDDLCIVNVCLHHGQALLERLDHRHELGAHNEDLAGCYGSDVSAEGNFFELTIRHTPRRGSVPWGPSYAISTGNVSRARAITSGL